MIAKMPGSCITAGRSSLVAELFPTGLSMYIYTEDLRLNKSYPSKLVRQ